MLEDFGTSKYYSQIVVYLTKTLGQYCVQYFMNYYLQNFKDNYKTRYITVKLHNTL